MDPKEPMVQGAASAAYLSVPQTSVSTPSRGTGPISMASLGDDSSARNRSSSPWAFQLSTKAASRVRSNDGGSGTVTPTLSRGTYRGMNGSTGPAGARQLATTRGAADSALLAAVRKQIESFEEKVNQQLGRMQTQSDRMRDAAFTRLEEKMSLTESIQPKLDRRIAELTGNYRGLSDEMQLQIRRIDEMDARLWEWRHSMDEEFRAKFMDFEQSIQKVASAHRVTAASVDDIQKKQDRRVQRLEIDMNRVQCAHEEAGQSLMALHGHCEEIDENHARLSEDHQALKESHGSRPNLQHDDIYEGQSAILNVVKQRLGDMSDKTEQALHDSHENYMRLETHEEMIKSLRTRHEEKDRQHREQLQQLQAVREQKLQSLQQGSLASAGAEALHERFEALQRRLEEQEASHEDLQKVVAESVLLPAGDAAAQDGGAGGDHLQTYHATVHECCDRLAESEARLAAIEDDLRSRSGLDVDLAPRVSELVRQIQEVVPKVLEQDLHLRDLRASHEEHALSQSSAHELMGRMQSEMRVMSSSRAGCGDGEDPAHPKQIRDVHETVLGISARHESARAELQRQVDALKQQLAAPPDTPDPPASAEVRAHLEHLTEELAHLRAASTSQELLEATNHLRQDFSQLSGHPELLADLQRRFAALTDSHQTTQTEHGDQLELLREELAATRTAMNSLTELGAAQGGQVEQAVRRGQDFGEAVDTLRREIAHHPELSALQDELSKLAVSHEASLADMQSKLELLKEEFRAPASQRQSELADVQGSRRGDEAVDELRLKLRELSDKHAAMEVNLADAKESRGTSSVEMSQQELVGATEEMRRELSALVDKHTAGETELSERLTMLDSAVARMRDHLERLSEQDGGVPRDEVTQIAEQLADTAAQREAQRESSSLREESLAVLGREVSSLRQELGQELRQELRHELQTELQQELRKDGAVQGLEGLEGLREEIAELRQLQEGSRDDSDLLELLQAVRQDEDAEHGAHQRLLGRVDELCERIAAVDAAVALATSGTEGGSGGMGIPPEFVEQLQALVERVEGSHRVTEELQAKIQALPLVQGQLDSTAGPF